MFETPFPPTIPVVAAVVFREERVLITRRRPEKRQGGLWEFPGGKVESEETPQEALRRELSEELCCPARVGPFLAAENHDYGDMIVRILAYHAVLDGEVSCLTDHDRLAWARPSELSTYELAPADRFLIDALIAKQGDAPDASAYG